MIQASRNIEWRLVLSRFLTKSGDQAWDFAVPISLLTVFPGQLQLAALFYFLVRLGHVILTPYIAAMIDRHSRTRIAKWAITSQAIAVLVEFFAIWMLTKSLPDGVFSWHLDSFLWFSVMTLFGLLSSLGSTVMNIAVANDIVPAAIPKEQLGAFNSRLRQVDLFTEVVSPILAGLFLLLSPKGFPLLGLSLIVVWNIISFVPEYRILMTVFRIRPDLVKKVFVPLQATESLWRKLILGWKSFFREPIAPAVVCYALLWLSVLSPHGVLLTAFLKGGWDMPELTIGVFRGLGALFGMSATFIYPKVLKAGMVISTARKFLLFQAVMVVMAGVCFFQGGTLGQYGFLGFILLSRIGLYGFSLGEEQIRQLWIDESVRGRVNGFASAMTGFATLILYGAGVQFSTPEQYSTLVVGSASSVVLAAILFSVWSAKTPLENLNTPHPPQGSLKF